MRGIVGTARLDLDQNPQAPLPERAVDKNAGVSDGGQPGFDGDPLVQQQVPELLGTGLGDIDRAEVGKDGPAFDQGLAPGAVPDDPQSGRQPDRQSRALVANGFDCRCAGVRLERLAAAHSTRVDVDRSGAGLLAFMSIVGQGGS